MKFLKASYFEREDQFKAYQFHTEDSLSTDEIRAFNATAADCDRLTIVAVTHIWETRTNPDPLRAQFKRVKFELQELKNTVVFYDFSSLPQRIVPLDSSSKEWTSNLSTVKFHAFGFHKIESDNELLRSIFDEGLLLMGDLYSNQFPSCTVKVLSLHSHKQTLERGWPLFELTLAGVSGSFLTDSQRFLSEHMIHINTMRNASDVTYDDLNKVLKFSQVHLMQDLEYLVQAAIDATHLGAKQLFDSLPKQGQVMYQARSKAENKNRGLKRDFSSFLDHLITDEDIIKIFIEDNLPSVWQNVNFDAINTELKQSLRRSVLIDLCFARFTNGTDEETVKQMILTSKIFD